MLGLWRPWECEMVYSVSHRMRRHVETEKRKLAAGNRCVECGVLISPCAESCSQHFGVVRRRKKVEVVEHGN